MEYIAMCFFTYVLYRRAPENRTGGSQPAADQETPTARVDLVPRDWMRGRHMHLGTGISCTVI